MINVQNEEGFVEPEPEPRQETVVSKDAKSNEIFKGAFANKRKLDEASHVELNEMSLRGVHHPFSSNSRGPIHEDRRLQIEELDEWRTHKPRTRDKPKLCQNELNTFPHQLKVGDKVVLDPVDPHIVTVRPDEEIPLTVLSIFPFGTVEVNHPKFGTFKFLTANLLIEILNIGFSTKTRPSTRACLGPCENKAKDFPNTGYDKTPRPCDMVVVEPGKTTRACNTPVWKNRGCGPYIHRRGRSKRSWTRSFDTTMCTHTLKVYGSGTNFKRAQIGKTRNTQAKIGEHGRVPWPCGLKSINTLHYSLFSLSKNPNPSRCHCIDWAAVEQAQLADAIRPLLTTYLWELFFGIIKPTYLELTMELCLTFHLQTVMMNYNDPGTVQFCLGGLICQLSVPEFSAALGLYTEEFKEKNEIHALTCHIHLSPSKCWHTLALGAASYNPSRSKASVLPPSLRYLHAILAHTITGRALKANHRIGTKNSTEKGSPRLPCPNGPRP
ncbi:hypothetical protein GOBAR_AA11439 [Gossypium barbadense]|uniref:Uncharacterized protein n=1 Tax=Gossypium barbadense TaxID=3634 RepID=A0A2P5Y0U3_GOSBA|nr:hypothetical protein GOBAR_AA11439 [Gossypium barbadense]